MRSNIKSIIIIVSSFVCVSCATTKSFTIPKEKLIELVQTSPVFMTISQPSSFEDRVGALGMFGAIGASIKSHSAGKTEATELNISDPSIHLKSRFQEFLIS